MIVSTRSNGRRSAVDLCLCDEDRGHLQEFQRLRDLLRDRTRSVAERYQTGWYLVGRPGSSKTHTVVETLNELDASWTYRNARMSAFGLWALLEEHPEDTIVLDDIPVLLKQEQAII